MEIELIFFHRQPGDLPATAAGEHRFMVLKKGVAGQLAQFNVPPTAAMFAAGLKSALRGSQVGHGASLSAIDIISATGSFENNSDPPGGPGSPCQNGCFPAIIIQGKAPEAAFFLDFFSILLIF
jgi:hypothetical protein